MSLFSTLFLASIKSGQSPSYCSKYRGPKTESLVHQLSFLFLYKLGQVNKYRKSVALKTAERLPSLRVTTGYNIQSFETVSVVAVNSWIFIAVVMPPLSPSGDISLSAH